jgi:hypothetical protein
MRGLVTAVGWFEPPARRAKTYRLDDLDAACTVLGLGHDARSAIRAEIDRLRATLGARPTRASA